MRAGRYVHLRIFALLIYSPFFLDGGSRSLTANPIRSEHITVSLLSEFKSVGAGQTVWIAWQLSPDPHWHTYWKNPGDSGKPTTVEWFLPEGSVMSVLKWPYPKTFQVGPVVNYGYDQNVLLMSELTIPGRMLNTGAFPIEGEASWLVCEEVCIPGKARIKLDIPLSDSRIESSSHIVFDKFRGLLPKNLKSIGSVMVSDDLIKFRWKLPVSFNLDEKNAEWYAFNQELLNHSASQRISWMAPYLYLEQVQNDYFKKLNEEESGVLVLSKGRHKEA